MSIDDPSNASFPTQYFADRVTYVADLQRTNGKLRILVPTTIGQCAPGARTAPSDSCYADLSSQTWAGLADFLLDYVDGVLGQWLISYKSNGSGTEGYFPHSDDPTGIDYHANRYASQPILDSLVINRYAVFNQSNEMARALLILSNRRPNLSYNGFSYDEYGNRAFKLFENHLKTCNGDLLPEKFSINGVFDTTGNWAMMDVGEGEDYSHNGLTMALPAAVLGTQVWNLNGTVQSAYSSSTYIRGWKVAYHRAVAPPSNPYLSTIQATNALIETPTYSLLNCGVNYTSNDSSANPTIYNSLMTDDRTLFTLPAYENYWYYNSYHYGVSNGWVDMAAYSSDALNVMLDWAEAFYLHGRFIQYDSNGNGKIDSLDAFSTHQSCFTIWGVPVCFNIYDGPMTPGAFGGGVYFLNYAKLHHAFASRALSNVGVIHSNHIYPPSGGGGGGGCAIGGNNSEGLMWVLFVFAFFFFRRLYRPVENHPSICR